MSLKVQLSSFEKYLTYISHFNTVVTPGLRQKDTLIKNLINDISDLEGLMDFEKKLKYLHTLTLKDYEKFKDRLEKLNQTSSEYDVDPPKFMRKYAKLFKNSKLKKILKDDPNLFEEIVKS